MRSGKPMAASVCSNPTVATLWQPFGCVNRAPGRWRSAGRPLAASLRPAARGQGLSQAGYSVGGMVFWQLTIDANDPAGLARFWGQALGYQPVPPAEPDTTWLQHYRDRLGGEAGLEDP